MAAAAQERPRVRIHSDSPFFSGGEQLVSVLLSDPDLGCEFDLSLQYRADPRYESGMRQRLPLDARTVALPLIDEAAWTSAHSGPLVGLAKAYAHATGLKYRFMRRDLPVIQQAFETARPDIVHIQDGGYPGAHSCLAAAVAARSCGARTVFMVNNLAQPYGDRYRTFDRGWDRRVVSSVDLWVTGSRAAGARLREVLGVPGSALRVVPNGLDARPPRLSRDDALAEVGADARRVVVACVANLERRKGQEHLLRALASLREMPGPTPQLVLEGEGPDSSRLRALIGDLGLGGDALMPGRLAHVPDLMAAADVIVLPSVDQEDFPNVILEAMAYGKPVIASALAGIPEQVVDGQTGVLVPPRDAGALAAALRRLAADPTLRHRLGEAGKVRHAALYTAGAAASRWADVYRDLLPGSSSR